MTRMVKQNFSSGYIGPKFYQGGIPDSQANIDNKNIGYFSGSFLDTTAIAGTDTGRAIDQGAIRLGMGVVANKREFAIGWGQQPAGGYALRTVGYTTGIAAQQRSLFDLVGTFPASDDTTYATKLSFGVYGFGTGNVRQEALTITSDGYVPSVSLTGKLISTNIRFTPVNLTETSNIVLDNSSNFFSLTLTGNRTLKPPAGISAGDWFTLEIKQDSSGGHTLAFDSAFTFPISSESTVSTTANAVDVLTCETFDGITYRCFLTKTNTISSSSLTWDNTTTNWDNWDIDWSTGNSPGGGGSGLFPIAANTILGNNTGATAIPVGLTASQVKTLLGIAYADIAVGYITNYSGSPTNNQILAWNTANSRAEFTGLTSALGYTPINKAGDTGIGNLSLTGYLSGYPGSPTNGQALVWNTTNSRFEATTLTGGLGYTPINKAGDSFTGYISGYPGSPTDGQVLTWVAANSRFETVTPSGGGASTAIQTLQMVGGY